MHFSLCRSDLLANNLRGWHDFIPSSVSSFATFFIYASAKLRTVLAADKKTDSYLIPGVYPVTADSKLNVALLSLTANLQANISISATFGSLTVSNPQLPLTFTDKEYQGVPLLLGDKSWGFGKSVVLPEGWYAVINPGQVVWGTVPDTAQLPAGLAGASLSKAALCTFLPVRDSKRDTYSV